MSISNGEPKTSAEKIDQKLTFYGLGQTVLGLLVAAFMIGSTILGVWTLVETREQSQENGEILERLIDCTEPGGTCYEESAKRTGTSIRTINEVSIAAAWCSETLGQKATMEAVMSCVTGELQEKK